MSTANFVPKRIRFSRYQKKLELQGLYIRKAYHLSVFKFDGKKNTTLHSVLYNNI